LWALASDKIADSLGSATPRKENIMLRKFKYLSKLKKLKNLLENNGFVVDHRSKGIGSFLYIKGENTAAEISLDDENNFWIELWETADEELDDEPVRDLTCKQKNDVLDVISKWIIIKRNVDST
jgi:hypothetical protein